MRTLFCGSTNTLCSFSWDDVISEMKVKAPLLHKLMKECTNTKKPRSSTQESIIGILVAIMCKYRCAKACLVQKLLSVIMYRGNCHKNVC